jgi:hypothetical protein
MRLNDLRVLPNRPLRSTDRLLISVSAGVFTILLAFSLVLFLAGGHWARRTLLFPETTSRKLAGETRFLPRRSDLAGNVRLLVEEALLGPNLPLHQRILPRTTRLQTVLARRGSVYVSLSQGLLREDRECPYSPQEALEALGTAILFNFPRIRSLHLLIEGQLPFGWGAQGLGFRPELLR